MYAREIVDNMLTSVFMHDAYVQYIAIVKSVVRHPSKFIPSCSYIQYKITCTSKSACVVCDTFSTREVGPYVYSLYCYRFVSRAVLA